MIAMKDKDKTVLFESDTSNLIKEEGAKETSQPKILAVKKLAKLISGVKILVLILIVIIIVEVVVGIKVLGAPIPKITTKTLEAVSGGKIVLVADKKNLPVGDTVEVGIRISTGGRVTDGTDIVINYNPALLTLNEPTFDNGSIYEEYPVVTSDDKTGIVRVSGITTINNSGFSGTGNFGTLSFKTKKAASTTVAVSYKKGSTTDSNIIETKTNKDILTDVYNLDLNIGSTNLEDVEVSPSNSCQGYAQICWDWSGKQGVQQCSGGKEQNSLCVWDPYLTVSCGPCIIQK